MNKPLIFPFKMSKTVKILYLMLPIIGGIMFLYFSNKYQNKFFEKYSLMKKETELNGVVSDIKHQKSTFITLNNKSHIKVTFLKNTQYKPNDFDIFIQCGDSISKKANSDTLYIYRKGKEYFFVANPLYYSGWE